MILILQLVNELVSSWSTLAVSGLSALRPFGYTGFGKYFECAAKEFDFEQMEFADGGEFLPDRSIFRHWPHVPGVPIPSLDTNELFHLSRVIAICNAMGLRKPIVFQHIEV
jgi:hypothetical protein